MVDGGHRIGRWSLPAIGLLAFVLAACAEEEPTEFSEGTRTGFMAACTSALEDDRFVADLCQCVFDRTQDDIAFAEFSAIDGRLVAEPARQLPPEIVDIVAACVIEVGDL